MRRSLFSIVVVFVLPLVSVRDTQNFIFTFACKGKGGGKKAGVYKKYMQESVLNYSISLSILCLIQSGLNVENSETNTEFKAEENFV